MKLTFSPASPFARKARIAAIETGLIDKIEFVSAAVTPGQPNEEYSRITPLKKLPVLILDNGDVILDSYVIVEYLDELAGGGKLIPASGPERWRVKSDHSLLQGMLDSMLLCRYENMTRPEPMRCRRRPGPRGSYSSVRRLSATPFGTGPNKQRARQRWISACTIGRGA